MLSHRRMKHLRIQWVEPAEAFDTQLGQIVNNVSIVKGQIETFKQLFSGHHKDFPASSCSEIAQNHPSPSSGYYWIFSSNGSAVRTYCDMALIAGVYQTFPASSCYHVSVSGYYWIRAHNGSVLRIYCDIANECGFSGGWIRVAKLQFTNGSDACPSGLRGQCF